MKIPETWKQYAVPFVVGAAFLALIWPTPYIIDDHRHPIWRISRFTGVRELATEDGWKSEKLVNEEHKKAEAATQAELDKALSQIKILPSADFKYAAVQNPTNWELKTSEYEGTHVEYYVVGEDGQEKFIGDQSLILLSMKEQSTSNVSVSYVNSPQAISSVPAGTNFRQKITLKYTSATRRNPPTTLEFKQPFVLESSRQWIRPKLN